MALVSFSNLKKNYVALEVLPDVKLDIEEGSLYAIEGPKGAGKATLFNLLSGFYRPTGGQILFDGKQVAREIPYRLAHFDLGLSFQLTTLFTDLTVRENVWLAIQAKSNHNFNIFRKLFNLQDMVDRAEGILKLRGLENKVDYTSCELSHGQQRCLYIGITIVGGGNLLSAEPFNRTFHYKGFLLQSPRSPGMIVRTDTGFTGKLNFCANLFCLFFDLWKNAVYFFKHRIFVRLICAVQPLLQRKFLLTQKAAFSTVAKLDAKFFLYYICNHPTGLQVIDKGSEKSQSLDNFFRAFVFLHILNRSEVVLLHHLWADFSYVLSVFLDFRIAKKATKV